MATKPSSSGSPGAALDLLRRAESDSVIVGFSGGKDALVTLDLCSKVFKRIVGMTWYLVPGLEVIEKWVRYANHRYGIECIQVPHGRVFEALRRGTYMPQLTQADDLRNVGQVELEEFVRVKTGISWIAYGHRMTDSIQRRFYLRQRSGFDVKGQRLFPIWDWTQTEVFNYIKLAKIPKPEGRHRSNGVTLAARSILWLYDDHRADYERVRAVFPDIEAVVRRRDMYAKQPDGGASS